MYNTLNMVKLMSDIERLLWCIPLSVFGWLIIVSNWKVAYRNIVKKEKQSWIGFFGGGFVGLAFMIFPNNPVWYMFWVAWLIDWGCVPGTMYTIIYYLYHRFKK